MCIKDIIEYPYAVKNPLKEKETAAKIQSATYDFRYWLPYIITMVSSVNSEIIGFETYWHITVKKMPKKRAIKQPYCKVFAALLCMFVPMHWAQIAEIADSILDGTKNKKPMIFSTMPTAAAMLTPLEFAITVIIINDI